MIDRQPLLIPNLEALCRKLKNPPAGLDRLLPRFWECLAQDAEFRAANLYLSGLLGDQAAQEQAKAQVLEQARDYGGREDNEYQVDYHTWCAAGPAMRTCVFFDWLDHHGLWSEEEKLEAADLMLHFGYAHCVNTLRSRVPSPDNQPFCMSMYCAVSGHVFRNIEPVADAAQRLHQYGLARLSLVLGAAPRDGYFGEGSTYQQGVVSPLAMWAAAFLSQLRDKPMEREPWPPHGATLLDVLRMEHHMLSPGLLMPPWDNYGWQKHVHLGPLAYYATATYQPELLSHAAEVWDPGDRQPYAAWGKDDRMWALIYWPDLPIPQVKQPPLSGWSLPETGATIDDNDRKARLMLAWDRTASARQSIARQQVNPNHVMYELDGEPIFGDGDVGDKQPFLKVSTEQILAPLPPEELELIEIQYSGKIASLTFLGGAKQKETGLAGWAEAVQQGLIGAANTVIVDNEVAYYPMESCCGYLLHEERSKNAHVVTAESLGYYAPHYDLTRARRTIASSRSGLSWIIDDYSAESEHDFTWQLYLQKGVTLDENQAVITTARRQYVTLTWLPVDSIELDTIEAFPAAGVWPETGSDRLRLRTRGTGAHFVVCLRPHLGGGLTIRELGPNHWQAQWPGGREEFSLPAGAEAFCELHQCTPESYPDLDLEPFATRQEPNEQLLEDLESSRMEDWRATVSAMHTLVARGVEEAYPLMQGLLRDPTQRYLVHSVAAWCLGHIRYAPALEDLRYMSNSPEPATKLHCVWAVEVIEQELAERAK